MATLPIALIQTRTPASPAAALAHVEPLIREAAASGARLILTPEAANFLIRDPAARAAVLTDQDGDAVVIGLRALAQELGVWLLIGSAIVQSGHEGDDRAANRSLLIDEAGAVVGWASGQTGEGGSVGGAGMAAQEGGQKGGR
jgi:predicted amidohydrolase